MLTAWRPRRFEVLSVFPHDAGPPSEAVLRDVLGSAATLWDELTEVMSGIGGQAGAWKSFGPRTGWRLDFRRGKGPLAGLYPQHGALLLGINLVRDEGMRAFDLSLSSAARRVLEASEPLRDGRFLLLRVGNASDVDDARKLLVLKTKRPRTSGA